MVLFGKKTAMALDGFTGMWQSTQFELMADPNVFSRGAEWSLFSIMTIHASLREQLCVTSFGLVSVVTGIAS